MTTLAEVELRLRGARGCTSGGRMAMCPVHESEGKHTPSLHVWEENGEVAWHCFAGCDHAAVGEALGIERRNGSDPHWTPDGCGAPIAEYPYVDEQGRLLCTVVRCDDHTFPPWRPDASSKTGKRWSIKGVRRVLYRLPQVLWAVAHDEVVYIAEGEKDANSLRAAGATATCNIGGAGKWRDDYSAALAGAHVIVVADKDAAGYAHASAVEAALLPVAASVGVVQAKTGKDASDHLAAGFGLEDFVAVEPDESGHDQEETPAAAFHLTELGNAERLATRHAGSVFAVRGADELRAYDPVRGIYTTEHGLLVRYAIDVVRSMYTEAADGLTDADKDLRRHAERSEAKRALDAMLSLAKAQPALEAEPEDFDAAPELLNTQSGVVNLATGDLHPHDPKYRMTKIAAAYAPGAPAPMWDGFLARIFEGDAELIAFMQRLFGYALTGHTGEQIFAIFFGAGANGKSVLVDCWQAALGDYAGTAAMSTFLSHRHDAVRTDLATLNGRRLVSTSESKPGQLIDAATIKVLTSKHVTCRFNYARGEFTYTPQYLVVLDTNYKPQVQCDDYAIKRRVLLVPFGVLIPDAEQDKKLTEKLIAAELPGILAWGVAGAVDYLKNGLCVPERVRAATDAYRAEMDALHQFWGEWLTFGHPEKWTTAEALRDALTAWARENGVEHKDLPKGSEWGRQLRERGARPDKKKVAGKTVSVWFGVQIVGADVQEELI